MQACKAYYNNGQFIPFETVKIPEGSHAIITILDFPIIDLEEDNPQLAAFDGLIAEIHGSGEEVPQFERARLHREVEL